jgi:hypothetical protein
VSGQDASERRAIRIPAKASLLSPVKGCPTFHPPATVAESRGRSHTGRGLAASGASAPFPARIGSRRSWSCPHAVPHSKVRARHSCVHARTSASCTRLGEGTVVTSQNAANGMESVMFPCNVNMRLGNRVARSQVRACPALRLVHRRLRHAGSEGREGAAGGARRIV